MPRGRPLKYKTVEEMQQKIDEYFRICEGEVLKNADGEVVLNKYGEPVYINRKPPTATGLALHLGLKSRQALLNYQGRKDFNDAITRAKLRIEEYAEMRLYDKDGCNGAKFNLINNFGWREKQDIEHSGNMQFGIKLPNDIDEE